MEILKQTLKISRRVILTPIALLLRVFVMLDRGLTTAQKRTVIEQINQALKG